MVWKWLSIPRPGFHRQGFPGLGGNKAWGLGKEETAVRASTRPDEGGGSQPILISIAPLGQAATQVPHPTHILIDRSIGESKGSSCSRSLWVQERAAAHEPVALSHERGSQRSKSMFAHLFTPNLQTEQVLLQRLPWQSNMSSLLYMILTILGGQADAASVSTSAPFSASCTASRPSGPGTSVAQAPKNPYSIGDRSTTAGGVRSDGRAKGPAARGSQCAIAD
jgi:hypothetical protein